MKQDRAKRKADDVRKVEYAEMAEKSPDEKARDRFKRPAYHVGNLIREQGRQMERKSLMEYLAEKYDIKEGVNAGGQVNPD